VFNTGKQSFGEIFEKYEKKEKEDEKIGKRVKYFRGD
jgi:hypothetical protein